MYINTCVYSPVIYHPHDDHRDQAHVPLPRRLDAADHQVKLRICVHLGPADGHAADGHLEVDR